MASGNIKNCYPNPLIRAGWISKIFSLWLIDFIRYGSNHELTAEDLYDTIPEDQSEPLRRKLEIKWISEINYAREKHRKPNLWKTIFKTYYLDFMKFSIFPVVSTILMTIEPFLLEMMMSYFYPNSTITKLQAYLNATVFVIFMLLRSIASRYGVSHFIRLGMRARLACSSLIFKKMIKLSLRASQNYDKSVINLLTADVGKFELLFTFLPYIVIVPIQLLVTTYIICRYIELNAALAGIVTMMLLTLPILALYNKIFLKLRTEQVSRSVERISLIGEVLNGIRAVKMYVWEKYFEDCVRIARRLEIKSHLKISYVASAAWSLACFCHRACVFVVILIYVPQFGAISAEKILPVSQHFNNLQKIITFSLFSAITRLVDMRVSMKRIEDFMLLEEIAPSVERISDDISGEIISIENATASWDDQSYVLQNIDLNFARKKLYAVAGAVGSGKSSLLKLILGEISLISGKVSVHGQVSYASQEPWLFPASIKDNILFGEAYDEKKYEKVVNACALLDDFFCLPYADETLVGDRGMNLSGGQCARVNLARAVYRDADVYLFDNPLSAVDTRVAKKLMDQCINNLLKDKTRILVTHNLNLLAESDTVIFLNSGMITSIGNLDNFRKSQNYLEDLRPQETGNLENEFLQSELNSNGSNHTIVNPTRDKTEQKKTEELIAKGAVEFSVYSRYIKAGGNHRILLIALLNCIFVTSVVSFDYGLVTWIQSNSSSLIDDSGNNTTASSGLNFLNRHAFLILGSLILTIALTSILINISYYVFMLSASNNIHNRMFSQLLKATMRFFETNPSGRILNRFTEDTGVADSSIPKIFFEAFQPAFLVMPLLISTIIINWWIIIPSGILIFLFFSIGRIFLATMQKLRRLQGNAKSPVLSFITSSMAGLTTIRACKAEHMVSRNFDSRLDFYTAPVFLIQALFPANYLWTELINLGLLTITVYVCTALKNNNSLAGYVGLTVMQIMNMTTELSTIMIRLVQALSFMPNIERMLQFMDLQEEDLMPRELSMKLTNTWPNEGRIRFEHLYLRYSDDNDPVLWDLSFTVASGSKVGIVGRTGAGKSSLITALFHLAKIDGSLTIDGVDTKNVELSRLRSKISIIPQEPFLFKGTLRKNLDPLNEFGDATLWSALKDVELKELFSTLNFSIDSGGSNLSLGQRQLVCLARAILRQNKILILDEATANIDLLTDDLIQKTIRSKFKKCTVLTIAHRLNTVMDSDKILVMDNGRIVEYDHPFLLLQDSDSHFLKMVEKTGNAKQLKAIAEKVYRDS